MDNGPADSAFLRADESFLLHPYAWSAHEMARDNPHRFTSTSG